MFCKNCYIIQSSKQSLKINHYSLSRDMRNWRSKESKLFLQRSHPERAGCQAVLHELMWGWRSCSNPVLGMEVSSSTTLSLCLPFISSVTAFSMLLSMVTFLYVQLCMCTDAHTQTCMHVTYLFLYLVPFSRVLGRQNHAPPKMTAS